MADYLVGEMTKEKLANVRELALETTASTEQETTLRRNLLKLLNHIDAQEKAIEELKSLPAQIGNERMAAIQILQMLISEPQNIGLVKGYLAEPLQKVKKHMDSLIEKERERCADIVLEQYGYWCDRKSHDPDLKVREIFDGLAMGAVAASANILGRIYGYLTPMTREKNDIKEKTNEGSAQQA